MSVWTLHVGEAEHPTTGLRLLPDASVDSIVTDPPAGIGFMGREWDSPKGGRVSWISWLEGIMREALRVMKPGAHGLVWALPRTSHWTATALEQAGFEIRDVIHHHFGTGFPKSLDVSKAIDEAAAPLDRATGYHWEGWGTALKPATEHWILVRKPLEGTVAANIQAHGTGGLNIDACRIGTSKDVPASAAKDRIGQLAKGDERGRTMDTDGFDPNIGRWPANLVLSHTEWCEDDGCLPGCPVALLDTQSGTLKSGGYPPAGGQRSHVSTYGKPNERGEARFGSSEGGASRFFFTAKPSTAEREADLALLPRKKAAELVERAEGSAGIQNPRAGTGRSSKGRANIHPTVKSLALMSWLVKLVTPPGGLVLDPFTGSGSTGVAALKLGFRFVGWELLPEHHAIAAARIGAAVDGPLFARAAR